MGATRESPSLDDATNDDAELEQLRRRAYGPDADIFDDSGALARLIELELKRGSRSGLPSLEPETQTTGASDDAPSTPVGTPEARTPTRRRRRVLAALAATVAGVLLFGVVSSMTGRSTETTLYPRAVVPAAAAEQLAGAGDLDYLGIAKEDAQLYDDYRGLNVWSARRGSQTICLFLTSTSPRTWRVDCTPWDRTPTINLTQYRDALVLSGGEPFRGAPIGTRIVFELRDGAVHVRVEPSTPGTTWP